MVVESEGGGEVLELSMVFDVFSDARVVAS